MIKNFQLSTSLKYLFLFLLFKSLFIIGLIVYGGIELGPDEAQYWTWSKALDWGYYSKPPGIAWQIWFGTKLFGHTEWGVRSLSLFFSLFQSFFIYVLAYTILKEKKIALWTALLMTFSPIGIIGSFFAITDVGFLICWTGACVTLMKGLESKKDLNPLLIGVWILFGALFKWPIYLFWIFFLASFYWYFPYLKKSQIIAGILISLIGLFPSIWWNFSHEWATFRHVFSTLHGGNVEKSHGNPLEFVGAQMSLFSPIFFIFLIIGLYRWFFQRNSLSPSLYVCGYISFCCLILGFLLSFFQKLQGNWILFAYPTSFVIITWALFQNKQGSFYSKLGLGISVGLTLLIFSFPSFYKETPTIPLSYTPSYRMNPFKHNLGSRLLADLLVEQGYRPEEHFLVTDKYQLTSLLSFYGKDKQRAYFLNLHHIRNNQFSYWPQLQEEKQRRSGFFVWTDNEPYLSKEKENKIAFYQNALQSHFEKVDYVGFFPLIYQGEQLVKGALIFRCANCKDQISFKSNLY